MNESTSMNYELCTSTLLVIRNRIFAAILHIVLLYLCDLSQYWIIHVIIEGSVKSHIVGSTTKITLIVLPAASYGREG